MNTIGATQAALCSAGTFTSTEGKTKCSSAPPGTFVGAAGATGYEQCAIGSFSAEPGAITCTLASAGSFVDTEGAQRTQLCPAGSYSPNNGASSCFLVPAGQFVSTPGQAGSEGFCAMGSFSAEPGAVTCTLAPIGFFVDTVGATEATPCPDGTESNGAGATMCTPLVEITDVLMVVGSINSRDLAPSGDRQVIALLESLGFPVVLADDDVVQASHAADKVLVMVSSSVVPGKIENLFAASPVPVVTWEGHLFDDFGFTAGSNGETSSTQTTLDVVDASHPLAAGHDGSVKVVRSDHRFAYASGVGAARVIAEVNGQPVLFAFDVGDALTTGEAPARRVGLFMNYVGARQLTAAGSDLVAAAILWATDNLKAPGNAAPMVDAGVDRRVVSATEVTVALDAAVSDDGLPQPPGAVTTAWSSPTGDVLFADPLAVQTTVTLPGPGSFVLTLTADDSDLAGDDTVTIIVDAPTNEAPQVDPGPDLMITLPVAVANLDGTVADDGLPEPAGLTVEWMQESGPTGVTFADAGAVDTEVSFPGAGDYVLSLTVSDGQLTTTANVTVTVAPEPPEGISVAFVSSRPTLPSGDRPIGARLEELGATVTVIDDDALLRDYSQFDLIFVSTSVVYPKLDSHFADVGIPVITTEQHLLPPMNMASPRIGVKDSDTINIAAPGSALAGSVQGSVAIASSVTGLGFGQPSNQATVVATTANQPVYFAYRTGDEMINSVPAPARRIAFPSAYTTARSATNVYWALFDAAVAFALTPD